MIVECPRCNARYRVDDDVVADEPTYKCSRCSHFFGQEAVALVKAIKQAGPTPSGEPPIIEPPEPAKEKEEAAAAPPPPPAPEPAPEPPFARKSPPRAATKSEPESLSLPFAASQPSEDTRPVRKVAFPEGEDDEYTITDEAPEEDFTIGADEVSEPRPRFVGDYEGRTAARAIDRTRRPYLIFLGVLLLVFGNLALYLRNHPETAERFLASIPFAGRILLENRVLQSRVYLRDIEGVYQQIKDGRTVFIVTGRAINTADAPLKGVEIESALYGSDGEPVAVKSIFCGNAMSLKIVKDLSSKEISILQRLQPPQRFEIAPGEAAGFSVVFLDPPSGFKEFSARVTAAQPALS